jgi:hypothetical protein
MPQRQAPPRALLQVLPRDPLAHVVAVVAVARGSSSLLDTARLLRLITRRT